jgi:hypothetical protein
MLMHVVYICFKGLNVKKFNNNYGAIMEYHVTKTQLNCIPTLKMDAVCESKCL